ncbi:MAG: GerMN domain-containing protein [Lachnospiraceae bacterium]|jgi:germination protein M
MKKMKRIISLILLIATVFLCGCSEKKARHTYLVYYSNQSVDDISHREYTMNEHLTKDMYLKVSELIHQMFDIDYTDEQLHSAKPDFVGINDYIISKEGLLTIDFDEGYLGMTNVQEIILRSSLVLTVIQISGITGVEITVAGEPICYSNGNPIGIMTADDFVNIILSEQGMLKKETDLSIYFANREGTALVPVVFHLEITSNNTSIEEYILARIIAGPDPGTEAYPTISPEVELINVVTSGRTCFVNFGPSFLEQEAQPVSDELLIYSIVNSLCRLQYVNNVQFLIDGEPATTLHTVTDISSTFTRNRSLEEPAVK